MPVWRPEDDVQMLVLSSYYVGSNYHAQVVAGTVMQQDDAELPPSCILADVIPGLARI